MTFAKVNFLMQVTNVIEADQDFVDNTSGMWVPYDPVNNYPKNYPGIGYTYNPSLIAFVAPKPYPSWSLDGNAIWQPPVSRPNDDACYYWDELSTSWIKKQS